MQAMLYKDAPYDVLYYSSELTGVPHRQVARLHAPAARGWDTVLRPRGRELRQPPARPGADPGTGCTGVARPGRVGPAGGPAPVPADSSNTPILVGGIVLLIAVIAIGMVAMRGRRRGQEQDEE